MTQENETNVANLVQPEPVILACEDCDGVTFHVYHDGSMVCAKRKCGIKTRFELFEDEE